MGIRVGFTSSGRGESERVGSVAVLVFLALAFPLAWPLGRSEANGDEYVRVRWKVDVDDGLAVPLTREVVVVIVRSGATCC